ncbi:MAG: hypothetical protein WAT35_12690, partial [Tabrizicola sp.]|uniref:hypothetical protein n=1 Tax=Tabrizicola sp. TaxID=2005166 RepID=UPI003BB145D2
MLRLLGLRKSCIPLSDMPPGLCSFTIIEQLNGCDLTSITRHIATSSTPICAVSASLLERHLRSTFPSLLFQKYSTG